MLRKIILITSLALAAQAHAGEAGKVIYAVGAVHVAEQPVREGARVDEGQLLSTGADGFLYVKTVDNGLFILRPNSKARIAAYRVDAKNPANSTFKLELLSGVARSKSGDAVKYARQNFRFNTPVAAIGVRGTDFTVYTDQDTSRVTVFTGGIVVSGFGGACRPEGGGPCEGATSRELSAAQRGQLLQVTRGQAAPQLLEGGSGAPDQVSPPRADEPLAKNGSSQAIDAKKSVELDRLVQKPAPTLPDTPPVVETPPQLPEREIQWGRFAVVADQPATIGFTPPPGAQRMISGNYVIFRTDGKEYVTPERGSIGFNLKGSDASIYHEGTKTEVAAQVQNGVLNVDFGARTFATSFDLVSGAETFRMVADGQVSSDGRFANTYYQRMFSNQVSVDGMLSNANGGSAGYVFQKRLDPQRMANGVTFWNK